MDFYNIVHLIIAIFLWLISMRFQLNLHPDGNQFNDTILSITCLTCTLFYFMTFFIITGYAEQFIFGKSIETIAKTDAKVLFQTLITSISTIYAGILIGFSMHRQTTTSGKETEKVVKTMNVLIFAALIWFSIIILSYIIRPLMITIF